MQGRTFSALLACDVQRIKPPEHGLLAAYGCDTIDFSEGGGIVKPPRKRKR